MVDFLHKERKVIVEVDGPSHVGREYYDERRTESLAEDGYHVYRVDNEHALKNPDNFAAAMALTFKYRDDLEKLNASNLDVSRMIRLVKKSVELSSSQIARYVEILKPHAPKKAKKDA